MIILSFVIFGTIFWIHYKQRAIFEQTVASLENLRQARTELTKGFLYASLAGDPALPFDRNQGLSLLQQAASSLETALRQSSSNETETFTPESSEAIRIYREGIEEFKQKQEEWQKESSSPKTETELRIAFLKLEQQADAIDAQTRKNLENLSGKLDIEFGLIYIIGLFLLSGGGIAVYFSQRFEEKSIFKIKKTQIQLKQAVQAATVGLWDYNLENRKLITSKEWKDILGYREGEIKDEIREWKKLLHSNDLKSLEEKLKQTIHLSLPKSQLEFRIRHKDGSYRWIICSASAFYDDNGKPLRFFGANLDITEIKTAQEQLQKSEQRFQTLVDEAPDGIFIQIDDKFAYVNQQCLRIFGAESSIDLIETPVAERFHHDFRERVLEWFKTLTLEKKSVSLKEKIILQMNGTELFVEISAIPFNFAGKDGCLVFMRDITTRKQLEQELLQSQKMEGIGRLAGGIAHDFNNLLTVIMAYTSLAVRNPSDQEKLISYLENIKIAGDRAVNLTSQLLAFARKQIISPRNLSLNEIILNIHILIARLIGEDIEIKMFLDEDLWIINADKGQFEQILLNLAANARDAMPNGGTLTIETSNVVLDANYAERHRKFEPGEYILLAVSDTGTGMEKSVQEHIFEPFFTTKELGKGTGLGLATCHGIVKQNGGHIWLYSEPNEGTTFKIYMPRAVAANSEIAETADKAQEERNGTETILLVEDEPIVRQIGVETLQTLGYQIIECESGIEAVEKVKKFEGKIDLLLTDVVMPQMSGKELAQNLLEILPDLRVLYVSGYTENTIVHHGILEDEVDFLQKPYTITSLAKKVREVLDKE